MDNNNNQQTAAALTFNFQSTIVCCQKGTQNTHRTEMENDFHNFNVALVW